jgi:uncharacterized protein DUF3891
VLVRHHDLVIGQPAHAWVSGQLARAWGNEAFSEPSPREPVCLAAEQHDVGWADADLAPGLDADGRPVRFVAIPRALHVAIWRDAPRRLLAQSRYAALLVSLHGTSLYARIDPHAHPPELAAEIRDYVAGQRRLQQRLAAGLDAGEVDRNRRLILTLDRLSLGLCYGAATTLEDVPAARGTATIRAEPVDVHADTGAERPPTRDDRAVPPDAATERFVVSPWPFAAARLVVGCEARRLPGAFADAAALEAALELAPWQALRWELSPG